jgi:hypothetical protein
MADNRTPTPTNVDADGNWVLNVTPPPKPVAPPRPKTLQDWIDEYPYETSPHPYIHKVKAIPMGFDKKTGAPLPAMNHSVEVLNMMAIHLARLDAEFGDDPEIHYKQPEHGPKVVFNPGTWIPISEPLPADNDEPMVIDLSGVPADKFEILKAAVKAEEIRQAKIKNADPEAHAAALAELAAAPTMDVIVAPAEPAAEVTPDDVP